MTESDPVMFRQAYYLEEKPERNEGPYLKEERDLLNALASWLGQTIELVRAEDALRETK